MSLRIRQKGSHAAGLIQYPLKTSENLRFSVFRGYIKRPVAWNGLTESLDNLREPNFEISVGEAKGGKTQLLTQI